MRFYLAPLEGVTGFVYRNAFNKYVGGLDKYFMPFLSPKSFGYLSVREKEELAPENNQGLNVIPQILTNDARDFLETAKRLQERGYEEVNFNLGCPSKPVVNKGRGAGFLDNPEQLDKFLAKIFEQCDMDISIKTRIGMESAKGFAGVLGIFNKYPVKELIIHPRVREDFYANKPNWEVFKEALTDSRAPVCYNGDIFTKEDYNRLIGTFPQLSSVMLGRGLVSNPFLVEEISKVMSVDGKDNATADIIDVPRFWDFHDDILENYQRVIPSDLELTVLFKMKELWRYMIVKFGNSEKWQRKINEAKSIVEYKNIIARMKNFEKCYFGR